MTNRRRTWRRAFFQLHLWLGLAIGLPLTVVCVSGSVLVFRSELQRAAFPELLAATNPGPLADISAVLAAVSAAYPGQRIAGVDAPTVNRQTFLAYVERGGEYRAVLIDPVSARVRGEIPPHSWISALQSLHFELLLGKTGAWINGIASLGLLGLASSGAVIWWRGHGQWRRGLQIRRGPWPLVVRDLHGCTGAWLWVVILGIAVTASSLTFPKQFRALLVALGPDATRAAAAPVDLVGGDDLGAAEVIHAAQGLRPGEFIARVVPPDHGESVYSIGFATQQPTPVAPSALRTLYIDRHRGTAVDRPDRAATFADDVVLWSGALHVGNVGGIAARIVWAVLGLVPPLLFVTGAVVWWRRVGRRLVSESSG